MKRGIIILAFLLFFTGGVFLIFRLLDQKQPEKGTPMEEKVTTQSAFSTNESSSTADKQTVQVEISTIHGVFTVKLFAEETPKTITNYLSKVRSGYYNGLTFHRVENWVVQGGDPLGNGTGGGDMQTELTNRPFKEGSVGVARGNDIEISNDSQFFICTQDCSWLDKKYTNFGEVVSGMEIVKKIEIGDRILKIEELK